MKKLKIEFLVQGFDFQFKSGKKLSSAIIGKGTVKLIDFKDYATATAAVTEQQFYELTSAQTIKFRPAVTGKGKAFSTHANTRFNDFAAVNYI